MIMCRSPAARRFLRAVFLALGIAGATSACTTIGYYHQAIGGHLDVMLKREAIENVLARPDTPPVLRRKLELVTAAREFASSELGLPDNGSYRSYTDLGRPYVVWNVFATPALSLEPVTSCFLFVGCLSYRGYFDEADAVRAGEHLRHSGHDVFVGGVAAYSTLGWFDDPVLNTMLVWDDARVVEVIFHELAHQLVYAPDDSVFNESFATALAEVGVARWAAADPANRRVDPDRVQRDAAFYDLLLAYRTRLETAFASGDDATKRERKGQLYGQLREDYANLKQAFGGYAGYDDWMATDLNNAKLSSVSTYHDYVPGFRSILARTNHDLGRFYTVVEAMTSWTVEQRRLCLGDPTTGAACLDELVTTH
jgi:predicted aminopeptidase